MTPQYAQGGHLCHLDPLRLGRDDTCIVCGSVLDSSVYASCCVNTVMSKSDWHTSSVACMAAFSSMKCLLQGMAGNIIHAIATTNAIIAGFVVIEAIKVLAGAQDKCKVQAVPSTTVLQFPAVTLHSMCCPCCLLKSFIVLTAGDLCC